MLSRNSLSLGIAHSEVRYGTERNCAKKCVFLNSSLCFCLFWNGLERVSKGFFFRLMTRKKIPSVFLSCEMVRKEIQSIFIFRKMVRTKLRSSKCFSLLGNDSDRNFELFYLPRNRQERNSERFCSAKHIEFQRNESIFRMFRVPRNTFFLRNWQTIQTER